MPTTATFESVAQRLESLIDWFTSYDDVTVAFSGGVDSSVVAAAAFRSGVRVRAMTAVSPSVPAWQRDIAAKVARQIGVTHHIVKTDEIENDDYARNDAKRCFHCKTTLYRHLTDICREAESINGRAPKKTVIVSGTNADDLGDYRPGIDAGHDAGVRTPLAELGLGKADIRALADALELSNADLPASPCLASRIAYGVEVTVDRLSQVERAETWLRDQGFSDVRVRLHPGQLARVEVPAAEVSRLAATDLATLMVTELQEIGFSFVTIDPVGLQSGSLNRPLIALNSLAGTMPLP